MEGGRLLEDMGEDYQDDRETKEACHRIHFCFGQDSRPGESPVGPLKGLQKT